MLASFFLSTSICNGRDFQLSAAISCLRIFVCDYFSKCQSSRRFGPHRSRLIFLGTQQEWNARLVSRGCRIDNRLPAQHVVQCSLDMTIYNADMYNYLCCFFFVSFQFGISFLYISVSCSIFLLFIVFATSLVRHISRPGRSKHNFMV